ncbi:hypothetical protein FJ365_02380, partial [Candidatus Dependentiae bacterium]|nr:hypothetical protein [Candidatus Dependentiae bacterium]
LGCCNNKFHKSCLIPQFTKTINTLGVPECALCRKKIGTPPAELVGAVPTVDALNLLFTGAFNGSTAFVQRALDMGLNVNTKKPANPEDDEYDGCTALHIAVDQSHSDVVALLLAHGAEVTATDATGWTPIHYAAMQPGGACLRQLITHGQSLGIEARNLKTPNNKLPLHIAVEYNNIENVRILLGTDNLHINTTTALKNTSLMLAATDSHMHDAMQTLLATPGIDINATNQYGNTALIIAAHRGYTLIVQKLIASGADINAVDALGHTALMVAKTEEIKAILRHAGAV